ncbi:hypothetical protein GQX74_014778 [Glossina fuscipes]|nr:hypothetical protein GQX74_014778 [Glossina fuscipes]
MREKKSSSGTVLAARPKLLIWRGVSASNTRLGFGNSDLCSSSRELWQRISMSRKASSGCSVVLLSNFKAVKDMKSSCGQDKHFIGSRKKHNKVVIKKSNLIFENRLLYVMLKIVVGFSLIRFLRVHNRIKYRNKCVLMIQTYVRGYLARKQHRPRYEGISKINKIRHNAQKTVETAACLKKGQTLEADRRAKEEEELRQREEQETKRIKAEIETRRKAQEVQRVQQIVSMTCKCAN